MAHPIREAVIGMQWGDEGKGKIIDEAATRALERDDGKRRLVVRFHGGCNAGHSIYVQHNGERVEFVTHAAPSGITSNADVATGPHALVHPLQFLKELHQAQELFNYSGRVMISERAAVALDYHCALDSWREHCMSASTGKKIGTTAQGIGPAYEDSARRSTRITFADYISDRFPDRLRDVLKLKELELSAAGVLHPGYLDELLATHAQARLELRGLSERLEYRMREYVANKDHIILEGAQATNLDVDMGTLPDATSSHCTVGLAFDTLALSRRDFTVYGVEKLYPTRVGSGVMPTLAPEDFGSSVGNKGNEIGATTRRVRRVGYPDFVVVRRSAMLNDCDGIYLTRVDTAQDYEWKVATQYRIDDKAPCREVPLDLSTVKPVYVDRTFSWHLWDEPDEVELRSFYLEQGSNALPHDLQAFVRLHDTVVECPVVGVSLGPDRGQTIRRER